MAPKSYHLGGIKQRNQKFKVIHGYTVSSGPALDTWDPVSKEIKFGRKMPGFVMSTTLSSQMQEAQKHEMLVFYISVTVFGYVFIQYLG